MSTEVARRSESTPVEYVSERPMRLVEWAEEARAAHALAEALCKTPFAGAYKDNPGGATAAILKGSEVGLTPVTSLGAFDLIQGTPAPKAITLRALVQSHGHRVWIESSSDTGCVAKATRRGGNEVYESRWTIARARAMDLTSKSNWKKQPAAMLIARATSEVCRLVAADVILGIGYSAEELLDEIPEPTTTTRRGAEPKTTAKRAAPRVQPEPDFDTEPDQSPAVVNLTTGEVKDPEPDLIDPRGKQMRALQAGMKAAGMGERVAALAFLADVCDRPVESSKTLTRTEAGKCLDELARMAEGRPFEPGEEPTT